MKYDAVMLDIDGTLWNSTVTTLKSMQMVFQKRGITHQLTREDIESVTGKPSNEALELLIGSFEEQFPGLRAELEEFETTLMNQEGGILFEGVTEGCRRLAEAGPLLLVSNCGESYLQMFLQKSGLAPFLTGYVCYGITPVSKGEMIQTLMLNNGIEKPVYVGDTAIDLEAAQEAGIDFIGASYGFGDVSKARQKFSSFQDITEFILQS